MSNSWVETLSLYPKQKASRRRPPRCGFRHEDYVVFSEARYLENRNFLCNTFFASIRSFFHQTANLSENQAVASRGKLIARFSGVQSTRFRKKMSLTHVSHKFEVWGRPLVTARVGQCLATER